MEELKIKLNQLCYIIDTDREPVPVMDFPEYVEHMHTNQDYLFSKEFSVRSIDYILFEVGLLSI